MNTIPSDTPRIKYKLDFRAFAGALKNFCHSSVCAASAFAGLCMISPNMAQAEEHYLGSVIQTAANFCPRGSVEADGQKVAVRENSALFSLIGKSFGGDGRTDFAVPDLTGSADAKGMRWCVQVSGQYPSRGENSFTQAAPSGLVIRTGKNFCNGAWRKATSDVLPATGVITDCEAGTTSKTDFDWYMGQIVTVKATTCPKFALPADGQSLPIDNYQALFSLWGTAYGGDGQTTFNLPDIPTTSSGVLSCVAAYGPYPSR